MRTKKVRGYQKVLHSIEQWREHNLELDIDNLRKSHRDYVKVWVHPYFTISTLNSEYPAPRGQARKQILNGLLDIYEHWHTSLEKLGEDYYLKLWLFPQDLSKSQVVCAIGQFLDFYEGTFHIPEEQHPFPFDQFGSFEDRLQKLRWTRAQDEIHLRESDLGEAEEYATEKDYREYRKWFKRKTAQAQRISEDSEGQKVYSVKTDTVWLGSS